MKKFLLIMMFFILVSKDSQSQSTLHKIDSNAISSAINIAKSLLGTKCDTATYFLFRISNQVIVVFRNNFTYDVFNGTNEFNIKIQKLEISNLRIHRMNESWIDKCFNKDICDPAFTYVGSDPIFLKNAESLTHTNYIYFVLYKSGIKKCEFNVPITLSLESKRKKWIPLKSNILKKVLSLMNPI